MNELTVFKFKEAEVRTVTIDGEPWFVGKDVADILGYRDTSDAIKSHCKGPVKRLPLQTGGGTQEMRVIPESDLYRLIMKSNMPNAVKDNCKGVASSYPLQTGGGLHQAISI